MKNIILIGLLLLPVSAWSLSIYSANGIGWSIEGYDAVAAGRAGAGAIGYLDGPNVSLLNPAMASIARRSSLGLTYLLDTRLVTNNTDTDWQSSQTIPVTSFIWYLNNRISLQLGLQPILVTSFAIKQDLVEAEDTVNLEFSGDGSVNLGSLGLAYNINDKLGLGISLDYYMGSISEVWVKSYPDDNFKTTSDNITLSWQMRPAIKFGVVSKLGFLQLGSYFRTAATIPVKEVAKADYGTLSLSRQIYNRMDDYYMPAEFGIGLGLRINSSFKVLADVSHTFWSEFKVNDQLMNFRDETRIAIGMELGNYDPLGIELLERIPIRAGFSVKPWYYQGLNQEYNVTEYIFSTGTSIPMLSQQPLDIGLQFTMNDGKDVSEKGIRLYFGITAAELWKLHSDK
jgi:long-subunit fatty acid transport protein